MTQWRFKISNKYFVEKSFIGRQGARAPESQGAKAEEPGPVMSKFIITIIFIS